MSITSIVTDVYVCVRVHTDDIKHVIVLYSAYFKFTVMQFSWMSQQRLGDIFWNSFRIWVRWQERIHLSWRIYLRVRVYTCAVARVNAS